MGHKCKNLVQIVSFSVYQREIFEEKYWCIADCNMGRKDDV